MSILDIIDLSQVFSLVILGILPLVVLGFSIMKPRGMYYMTVALVIFGFIALFSGHFAAIGIYLLVYIAFSIFWAIKGGREYERCGHRFDIYRNLYQSYYADDLNDDGIIDAFDNWKIAHDPRYSWIFASRKVRRERKLQSQNFYNSGIFNAGVFGAGLFGEDSNEWDSGFSRDNSSEQRKSRSEYTDRYSRRSQAYSGQAGNRDYGPKGYSAYYGNTQKTSNTGAQKVMSEEEQKVAAQHAFARKHNLRYFAMCSSKDEGKRLYHKYAAKYHPDNPTTGNKEKFIAIDEEYNRFCAIDELDFICGSY